MPLVPLVALTMETGEITTRSSCNIAEYSPHVLFKAFANVAGPTPNLFVSIHGGTPEESNYKAFKEWVKPFQSKATKREKLIGRS